MSVDQVDPAQLRALRDLAQLRKDRALSLLSRTRAVVARIKARLQVLDAGVAAACAAAVAQADPVSFAASDDYVFQARARRVLLNTDLAQARARADDALRQATRATGQVEVLERMQELHASELRLALARRDQ